MKVNPHQISDWAIATGRQPLNSRRDFLACFADDPVTAVGAVLTTLPTRDVDRPCPLFAPPRPDLSRKAVQGHAKRKKHAQTVAEVATAAARSALALAGQDADDPAVKAAVATALKQVAVKEEAHRRRVARSRQRYERRARQNLLATLDSQVAEVTP